jgi:hypothetical protein
MASQRKKNPARKIIPIMMEGLEKIRRPTWKRAPGVQEETAPIFFMPWARSISPTETKIMATARTDKVLIIRFPFSINL